MVRCINADGTMIGVIPTREALKLAMSQGLDLVEVSPNADPPVCRIMDYGKFRYNESIREREARKKAHRHSLKEIKFHANVADHDYGYKVQHIRAFLQKGHKVKVSLQFRGRENVHRELGFAVIQRVLNDCQDLSVVETAPRLMGNTVVALLAPVSGKRQATSRPPEGGAVAAKDHGPRVPPSAAASPAPTSTRQEAPFAGNPVAGQPPSRDSRSAPPPSRFNGDRLEKSASDHVPPSKTDG